MEKSTGSHDSSLEEEREVTPSTDVNGVTEHHEDGPTEQEGEEVVLTGCGASACCNPQRGLYRFIGLLFMCFLSFGSYFCYDTPGALQDHIKEDMEVNTTQFASLYSLYSWPNVVLCFIGGFLIDRIFGIRWGTIIFSSLVTLGQFIYSLGGIVDQFWLMQFGRFVFGIGGESLAVAQNIYTVSWFKGKELNTVFGLLLSMARVGSTVNFLTMIPIYNWVNNFADGYRTLGISLMLAGITCVFSLACAIILGLLDKRRSEVLRLDSAKSGEKVRLSDVLSFPLSFWLLSIICVSYYVAIFPFIGLAKVFFMRKFDLDDTTSNAVSSIVYIISAFASPLMGFVVDRTGRNILWVFIAVIFSLGCHAMLTFTFINPFIPMSILGLAYSLLASALWPMVSLIIPEHQLGTAYGMMQSVQNLGLALISMLAGLIVDKKGYLVLEIFYMVWLCAALASTALIAVVDSNGGGYLLKSPAQREKEIKASEGEENSSL
ncbi:major facilitator superfamily domain-containing protein 1-like isoform X2 [Homarus americanus]|uniref:major facilitator superfamily domain-containing protein 1-like isoform X2 n=1 Tax=Homarus americanus TaxID=6706 RepID=UPI001C478B21|nr:major facilitator superfamily domain-containing protein 1-like isoform X2 [Homarus americanus]XP_042237107.1 major facilitator superfamily domain-containing protein 1-like isoform X2 [Homarus americanus]